MSIAPSRIEYHLGTDKFGRKLTLIHSQQDGWLLHQEAINQRDEEQRIYLSQTLIRSMAEIVK